MQRIHLLAIASASSLFLFNPLSAQATQVAPVQPEPVSNSIAPTPIPRAGSDIPLPSPAVQPGTNLNPAADAAVDQEFREYSAAEEEKQRQEAARIALERQEAERQRAAQEAARIALERQEAQQREAERRQVQEVVFAQVIEPEFVQPQPEQVTRRATEPARPQPAKLLPKKIELGEVTFLCGENGGTPATVAKVKDQNEFFVILWESKDFEAAGYNPQTRCKQVSARFEEFNKENLFTYLTTGRLNGQPVVCLTSKPEGTCGDSSIPLHQGLLFTLKPGQDSNQTLENLVSVIEAKSGGKILEQ